MPKTLKINGFTSRADTHGPKSGKVDLSYGNYVEGLKIKNRQKWIFAERLYDEKMGSRAPHIFVFIPDNGT